MYDFLVVGKGLIVTAATRYLSLVSPNTAVVGPDEPADWASHEGVFASHFDEGRLTHRLSKDLTWAQLAQRSIDQYRILEAESGIPFYSPSGGIYVTFRKDQCRLPGRGLCHRPQNADST